MKEIKLKIAEERLGWSKLRNSCNENRVSKRWKVKLARRIREDEANSYTGSMEDFSATFAVFKTSLPSVQRSPTPVQPPAPGCSPFVKRNVTKTVKERSRKDQAKGLIIQMFTVAFKDKLIKACAHPELMKRWEFFCEQPFHGIEKVVFPIHGEQFQANTNAMIEDKWCNREHNNGLHSGCTSPRPRNNEDGPRELNHNEDDPNYEIVS
ncbi:hypothetical protein WN48_07904 [Eufriesea mexicana]|uniref:Uncharacterized protein n=1 Tax=Eufriesea mexicana TaxID=516756 RepID=A0A310SGZ0_9HYME|nr:hypothetical protein WN48_07904 [Eufriesea mexicana]